MNVVGICRFSLLGRGDWKVYQDATDAEVQKIAEKQAAILFTPERMAQRLATLQHLTLASLRAQTDQDFLFIVLASEIMPEPYRQQLVDICRSLPQAVLRFFPLTHVGDAQREVFSSLQIELKDTLQFRLDDDDAVCATFVERKRDIATRLAPSYAPLAISFRTVLFCSSGGQHDGIYSWDSPFFSAGAALYHPDRSIFAFGHFAMGRRFASIVLTGGMSLVTHNGQNDTQFDEPRIRRQRFIKMEDANARSLSTEHFPFLSDEARQLTGLPV